MWRSQCCSWPPRGARRVPSAMNGIFAKGEALFKSGDYVKASLEFRTPFRTTRPVSKPTTSSASLLSNSAISARHTDFYAKATNQDAKFVPGLLHEGRIELLSNDLDSAHDARRRGPRRGSRKCRRSRAAWGRPRPPRQGRRRRNRGNKVAPKSKRERAGRCAPGRRSGEARQRPRRNSAPRRRDQSKSCR